MIRFDSVHCVTSEKISNDFAAVRTPIFVHHVHCAVVDTVWYGTESTPDAHVEIFENVEMGVCMMIEVVVVSLLISTRYHCAPITFGWAGSRFGV